MSASLRLHDATFAFRDERPVLDHADLHLRPGWTGLVGPNGSGKSTLLRILAGELAPGLARSAPTGLAVVRLDQSLEVPEPRVIALGPPELHRWPTLSPGERRRLQVTAALLAEPDVLLLDEPDNHLDAEAADLLVAALRRFRGIGVLVSHDRRLLDTLTTRTLRLQDGRIESVEGPISHALAVWEADAHARRAQLDAAGHARDAARRRLHADPHDHDARSMARKYRAETAEQSHAKQLARAHRAAGRAEAALDTAPRPEDLGRSLLIQTEPPKRTRFLDWVEHAVKAGERPLLTGLSLTLDYGDRVWLRGANGAGKSTLLRALLEAAPLPAARLLYLPQELSSAETEAAVATLHGLPKAERGRVLQLVAALGVDPATLLATPRPSPGEARKLALALGLARRVWLVALDEPDNHLDLPSRQRLEAALRGYTGALLLVTHDEALAAAATTTTWTIEGGGLRGGR